MPTSLPELSLDIQAHLKTEVEALGVKVLHISAFGYLFDSAFWVAVAADAERDRLLDDEDLKARLQAYIRDLGYADLARKEHGEALVRSPYLFDIGVTYESQETVDRVWGGNWYHAMK